MINDNFILNSKKEKSHVFDQFLTASSVEYEQINFSEVSKMTQKQGDKQIKYCSIIMFMFIVCLCVYIYMRAIILLIFGSSNNVKFPFF